MLNFFASLIFLALLPIMVVQHKPFKTSTEAFNSDIRYVRLLEKIVEDSGFIVIRN